jgi:outer membrane receptor protein involved in Fe transport
MTKFSVAMAFAVALGASAAQAQSAADDEIIVTATKRGEARAQDLPLAMNAFGEAELARRNVEDLQ